jgi:hypothetical protein
MLRIFVLIVLFLAIVVGLAAAWGNSLPREHVVASRIVLPQRIDQVWAVVRDPTPLVGVWPDLTRFTRTTDESGREVWVQTVDGFSMRLTVTQNRPPTRLVTTIDATPDAAFGGRWTYDLKPAAGGTELTVTEAGWIANPFYRVMGRLFGLHSSIEGYLKGVAQHFAEGARPERVEG